MARCLTVTSTAPLVASAGIERRADSSLVVARDARLTARSGFGVRRGQRRGALLVFGRKSQDFFPRSVVINIAGELSIAERPLSKKI
jgi:hypothetical protein